MVLLVLSSNSHVNVFSVKESVHVGFGLSKVMIYYDLCNLDILVLNGVELYMTREIINVANI